MTALLFAAMARDVQRAARAAGAAVPVTFRSPPVADVDRSIRRRDDGSVVVAVRIADRAPADVLGDLVAGLVAAQGLPVADAGILAGTMREVLHDGWS